MAKEKLHRPQIPVSLWRQFVQWCEANGYTHVGGLRRLLDMAKGAK